MPSVFGKLNAKYNVRLRTELRIKKIGSDRDDQRRNSKLFGKKL